MINHEVKWNDKAYRMRIIREILGQENRARKEQSLKEVDVYRGNISKYVYSELCYQYGNDFAKEIPVHSSVNVAKRVVDNDSKLYSNPVKRTFKNVSDRQNEALNNIYKDLKFDNQMLKSSRYFNLQQQNIPHILPKGKQLICRVYKMHQIDAVPVYMNPEKAQSYIISNFDRSLFNQLYKKGADQENQDIADYDDALLGATLFAVWDREFQFMMNGKGEIVSQENDSKTPGHLPFIDVHGEKDFTFFVECGNSLVDFTIQYNTSISSEAQVVKLQGFAQPFLKGPAAIFNSKLKIGPDKLLQLATDNINGTDQIEFGYANPNSDLTGVREHRVQILRDFLSTREIPLGKFEGSTTYSSGIERLLAMVKEFDRSRELIAIYADAERKAFRSVVHWHNAALGTDLLDDKYLGGSPIPEDAEIEVEFHRPEMVMTEMDRLEVKSKKVDSGFSSKVLEIMEEKDISEQEAIDIVKQIAEHEELEFGETTQGDAGNPVRG